MAKKTTLTPDTRAAVVQAAMEDLGLLTTPAAAPPTLGVLGYFWTLTRLDLPVRARLELRRRGGARAGWRAYLAALGARAVAS